MDIFYNLFLTPAKRREWEKKRFFEDLFFHRDFVLSDLWKEPFYVQMSVIYCFKNHLNLNAI